MKISNHVSKLFLFISALLLFGNLISTVNASVSLGFSAVTMSQDTYMQRTFSWVAQHDKSTGALHIVIHAPSLSIYDPTGRLIYYGADAIQNAAVLKNLPNLPSTHLTPFVGVPSLDELVSVVPSFSAQRDDMRQQHHYLIYALTSRTPCKTCYIQDKAIHEAVKRKDLKSFDTVQLAFIK